MTDKQRRAIRLMIDGNRTTREIAQEIGVAATTVSAWKRKEEFVAEYKRQLNAAFNDAASRALQTVTQIMENSDSESQRLAAAKLLMEKAGVSGKDAGAPQTDMTLNITVDYTGGDRDGHSDAEQ